MNPTTHFLTRYLPTTTSCALSPLLYSACRTCTFASASRHYSSNPNTTHFISQLRAQHGTTLSLNTFTNELEHWCETNRTQCDVNATLTELVEQNVLQFNGQHPVLSQVVQLESPTESEQKLQLQVFPVTTKDAMESLLTRYTEVQEQVLSMQKEKDRLDEKAVQRLRTMIYAACGYLSAQMAFLGRFTWKDFGWDVMEPFCYFTSFTVIVASYLYFVAHRPGEYTYEHASENLLARQRGKLYVKHQFNIDLYHNLLREQAQLRSRLEDESLIPLPELLAKFEQEIEAEAAVSEEKA